MGFNLDSSFPNINATLRAPRSGLCVPSALLAVNSLKVPSWENQTWSRSPLGALAISNSSNLPKKPWVFDDSELFETVIAMALSIPKSTIDSIGSPPVFSVLRDWQPRRPVLSRIFCAAPEPCDWSHSSRRSSLFWSIFVVGTLMNQT